MGGKSSTTTSTVKIPPEVLARYNAVNARAEGVAERPFQIYGTDPSDFVAQINAQQQQGIQNVNAAAGAYKPYFEQARTAGTAGMASAQPQDLDIGRYLNPYQQQVIDATMRQMGQANEQAQSGALGTAASSGAFGGDRAGIAAANLANQQGLAMGSTLAGLNAQNYQQALAAAQQQQGLYLGATQADLARLMQGGQFLAGLGQAEQQAGLQGAEAQINAGTLGQQTEQAGKSALYNQFMQEQAYPFQVAQFLANIAMGTGALSGSTTTTTQPTSWFSDRRLKEDIRRIGHTDDGMPIYKYKYKGDDNHQTHIGFMADEVEQVKPEAVGVSGGYKTVDYDRATKADGGGVAGPYGAAFGSQNPYAGGYVPQAILPVSELMVADPVAMQNSQQNMAQQLAAAAAFGENMVKLRETFGKGGDFWMTNEQRRAMEAAGDQAQPATAQYRGGVVNRATGGAAYLQGQKAGAENPVGGQGYLSDTLAQQEEQKPAQLQSSSSAPGASGGTGLQNLASAAGTIAGLGTAAKGIGMLAAGTAGAGSTLMSALPFLAMSDRRMKHDIRRIGRTDHGMPIYSFKYKGDDREQTHIGFMADEVEKHHPDAVMTGDDGYKRVDYGQSHKFYQGGVVRPGHATDGAVAPIPATEEEIIRRRLLTGDVPPPATLGSQPEARVTPVAEEAPAAATAGRPRLSFPTEGGVAPAAVERLVLPLGRETPALTGGVAPAAADYPVAQPAPAPAAVTGVVAPQPEASSGWETFKPYVIQRESGGDYDALYGFSNREGGPFAGVKVTDMTVDEAIKFSDPNGPYAQWVKSQLGYVATPMGGPQIVGTTLRGVKDEMGLTGDELMTPELQDRMAKHLYDRYGETPWALPGGVAGGSNLTISQSNGPGLAGAGMSDGYGIGGDKPYEERTRLGQMFYDRDGRVNKDALLSILSGIGTMASSPSLYLGSAILQGIGGAANTYAALETARGEKTAKGLENLRNVALDTLRWNEMNGTNLTPAQYAAMMQIDINVPANATAQTILEGAYTPTTGSGLKKLSYSEFQNGTVNIGGHIVPMQNDPASLARYIQDNAIFRNDPVLGGSIAAAEARLEQIEKDGRIFDINGNLVVDPRTVSAADEQAQNEANRLATAAFREQMNTRLPQIPLEIDNTLKQAAVFSQLEAGALAQESTALAAMAEALGLPVPEGVVADRALVEQAIKYAAQREMARAEGLGATEAQLGVLGNISANPNLQPEAVKAIIASQLAHSLRERRFYEMRDEWASSEAANGRPMDQSAYVKWFNQNEPYEEFYKEAVESLPTFAGELGSRQKPHGIGDANEDGVPDGISEEQYNALPNGSYYYGTDGRLYGPKGRG